jgi:hypothetical protein
MKWFGTGYFCIVFILTHAQDFSVSHPPLASTGSLGIHYSYIQHKVAINRYIQTIELATSDKRQVAIK